MKHRATIVLLACVGCGGRMITPEADGGLSQPHGAACTQSSCASSVHVIASVPTNIEPFWGAGAMFVGGGFLYVAPGLNLMRVPVAGGDLSPFVSHDEAGPTVSILANDHDVYWVTQPTGSAGARLLRAPHAGGAPLVITTSTEAMLLADATGMFFSDNAHEVTRVADDSEVQNAIPFTRTDRGVPIALLDGQLFRADCTSVTVSPGAALPVGYGMIVTDTHCYELHGDCGASSWCGDLVAIPRGGGPMTVVAKAHTTISQEFDTVRMMSDSEGFYLLHSDGPEGALGFNAKLIRVPFGGGDPVEITTDDSVKAFMITADTIYWATPKQIVSMPKWAP